MHRTWRRPALAPQSSRRSCAAPRGRHVLQIPRAVESLCAVGSRGVAVVLYTWNACGHCERARELLRRRGVAFREHALDGDVALRRELARRLGRADMPFALVDGELLGGVAELERRLEDDSAAGPG